MNEFTPEELEDLFNACDLVKAWGLTRTRRDKLDKAWAERIIPIQEKIHRQIFTLSMEKALEDLRAKEK